MFSWNHRREVPQLLKCDIVLLPPHLSHISIQRPTQASLTLHVSSCLGGSDCSPTFLPSLQHSSTQDMHDFSQIPYGTPQGVPRYHCLVIFAGASVSAPPSLSRLCNPPSSLNGLVFLLSACHLETHELPRHYHLVASLELMSVILEQTVRLSSAPTLI